MTLFFSAVTVAIELNGCTQSQATERRCHVLNKITFASVVRAANAQARNFKEVGNFVYSGFVSRVIRTYPTLTEVIAAHTNVGFVETTQATVASLVVGIKFQFGFEKTNDARSKNVVGASRR